MDSNTQEFKIRLGLFITGGFALFLFAIFIIGRQKNLFNPVFSLNTTFSDINGLQVGNNVRFSGINVGTVDNIKIINDSTVRVDLLIKKNVQKFIRGDCEAAIGSEGIIGDRILIIGQGRSDAPIIKDGQHLSSTEPVETDAIMASLQVSAGNAEIITRQLSEIMTKINSGNGTLGRLIEDSTIANNLSKTMLNLKQSTKGLDENMEAAKHNFLLKGYFNKKARAAAKLKKDEEKKMKEENKIEEDKRKIDDDKKKNENKK